MNCVDIEVLKELHEKFSEMSPLFVVIAIPEKQIPDQYAPEKDRAKVYSW